MKKFLFLIFTLLCTNNICFSNTELKGTIEKSDIIQENETMTGEYVFPKKFSNIKINVLKVADSELSQNGEEFFAKVTEDVEVENGIIIPSESIVHGFIKAGKAGKFGHNGYLKLDADYIILPNGEQYPVKGGMTTKISQAVSITSGIAERTVYTLTGAVLGSGAALNIFGAESAILSSGATIGTGAAIGAIGGIFLPFEQKGKNVAILPDDDISIKIKFSQKIPVYKKNAFNLPDFNDKNFSAEIKNIEYKKNAYNLPDNVILELKITNKTDEKIDIFNMYILDEKNKKYYANMFKNEKLRDFAVFPDKTEEISIPFAVDKVNDSLWLVFEQNEKIISKISVSNAYKNIPAETKNKNKKVIETKKNFYRTETPFD